MFYRSRIGTPRTVAETLEHLTNARLDVWRAAHMERAELQAVEQRLLQVRRHLEAMALKEASI